MNRVYRDKSRFLKNVQWQLSGNYSRNLDIRMEYHSTVLQMKISGISSS